MDECPSRADVLITGGSGFIGRHLAAGLRELYEAAPPGSGISWVSTDRSQVDLLDEAGVRDLFHRVRPRVVVHLAASSRRSGSSEDDAAQWRDTFDAGRHVLEAAARSGVPHVLAAGSIAELGDSNGVLTPDRIARPRTTYGTCKLLLSNLACSLSDRFSTRVDWFRPFVVYGPGQTGSLLIPYLFQCAVQGEVAELSDGSQTRDFVFIDDIVRWVLGRVQLTLETPVAEPGFRIHHLGTGIGTPVAEVAQLVMSRFPDLVCRFGLRPRREGEPDVQIAAETLTGTYRNVADGINATADWWAGCANTGVRAQ